MRAAGTPLTPNERQKPRGSASAGGRGRRSRRTVDLVAAEERLERCENAEFADGRASDNHSLIGALFCNMLVRRAIG
jgi:hypothetical protein